MDYGPAVFAIGPGGAFHFNSDDLECGNPDRGLQGGTGSGEGRRRLELTSDVDIEVLTYVRQADGFLTSMHDTAPREDARIQAMSLMRSASGHLTNLSSRTAVRE